MNEKFFIITDESDLHKEYFAYRENRKVVNELIKSFFKLYEIQTTGYRCGSNFLQIVATKEDKEKSVNQLCKNELNDGLYSFKKNSEICKAWVQHIGNLRVLHEPLFQFYFNCCGRGSYRLFDIDGILYGSYSNASEINVPKGFTEIKGSEFFKIVEDYEAKQEASK